jgi:hypothetical protein
MPSASSTPECKTRSARKRSPLTRLPWRAGMTVVRARSENLSGSATRT